MVQSPSHNDLRLEIMTAKKNRRPVLPEETYTVTIRRDAETGMAVFETWRMDGKQHRPDGPASIARDAFTGVMIHETWIKNGELHRENGPAHILRKGDTGRVYSTEWFKDGEQVPAPPRQRTPSRSSTRQSLPPSKEQGR